MEVDMNGDGEISVKEFKKMMNSMLIGKTEGKGGNADEPTHQD